MQLRPAGGVPPISALLRDGGICYDIEAIAKADVLRELVERLPLPPGASRVVLLREFEAREAKGSTGIGRGVAIPHLRDHAIFHAESPLLSLALLKRPIDFNAIDRAPVHAVFMIVSPSAAIHVRLIGELGFILRDAAAMDLLRQRAPAVDIIRRIEAIETTRHSRLSS